MIFLFGCKLFIFHKVACIPWLWCFRPFGLHPDKSTLNEYGHEHYFVRLHTVPDNTSL